jgi:hypothetical protein
MSFLIYVVGVTGFWIAGCALIYGAMPQAFLRDSVPGPDNSVHYVGDLGLGLSYLFFKGLNRLTPMRVPPVVELERLDIPKTGVLAYPDFLITFLITEYVASVPEAHQRISTEKPFEGV